MTEEVTHKKKWYKNKKTYIILGVLIFVIIIITQISGKDNATTYETVKVGRGALVQTVDATGKVESANEIDLRLESSGKLMQIFKNVNDSVKRGDVIAELDLSSLNAGVAQASASVAKAQASLDKLLAGQTELYLANLEARLAQSQANLEQLRAGYDDQIANGQATVDTAKINLDMVVGGENSKIVQNEYNDAIALLQSNQNTLATALNASDNILGIDNTIANDDFETVLSATDSGKLNIAKTKYYTAKASKNDADTIINVLNIESDHAQIDYALDKTESALSDVKNLLFAMTEVLNNTVAIGNLSQAELDTLKSGIQTVRTTAATSYSSLITEMQAIDTAKNSFSNYKITYDKAVANLENLLKKKEADLNAYQALVDQANASYNDAKNPPRIEDLASYQASVSEANANLAQAVANRNKARLIAPVDGVIGKIDKKIGEYVSAQDVVAKLVSPHFEIKVDIPETDIIKIALGNTSEVKLDAYGDEISFRGIVAEIEIGETIIQDVVYYTVTLTIEDGGEHQILNGMTANVIFNTAKKDGVLSIPQRAVRSNTDGSKYVRVLEDGQLKDVMVKVGLRGDGGLVEVIDGLMEGQEVIVNTVEGK